MKALCNVQDMQAHIAPAQVPVQWLKYLFDTDTNYDNDIMLHILST